MGLQPVIAKRSNPFNIEIARQTRTFDFIAHLVGITASLLAITAFYEILTVFGIDQVSQKSLVLMSKTEAILIPQVFPAI